MVAGSVKTVFSSDETWESAKRRKAMKGLSSGRSELRRGSFWSLFAMVKRLGVANAGCGGAVVVCLVM
jgi:hypothetical protein